MKEESKYIYSFKLFPTSPMKMFQKNGMLRATEVKPKLDKYLNENANILESWKIKNSEALNYKMSIKQNNNKKEEIKSENQESIIYPNIQIICLIPELLLEIKKHLKGFFVVNNFGKSQNRGFGGFQLENQTIKTEEIVSFLKKKYKCQIVGKAQVGDNNKCKSFVRSFNKEIKEKTSNKKNNSKERLPSPLFFKIINNNVYMVSNNNNDNLLENSIGGWNKNINSREGVNKIKVEVL